LFFVISVNTISFGATERLSGFAFIGFLSTFVVNFATEMAFGAIGDFAASDFNTFIRGSSSLTFTKRFARHIYRIDEQKNIIRENI
jgi:hypothetical protein